MTSENIIMAMVKAGASRQVMTSPHTNMNISLAF